MGNSLYNVAKSNAKRIEHYAFECLVQDSFVFVIKWLICYCIPCTFPFRLLFFGFHYQECHRWMAVPFFSKSFWPHWFFKPAKLLHRAFAQAIPLLLFFCALQRTVPSALNLTVSYPKQAFLTCFCSLCTFITVGYFNYFSCMCLLLLFLQLLLECFHENMKLILVPVVSCGILQRKEIY